MMVKNSYFINVSSGAEMKFYNGTPKITIGNSFTDWRSCRINLAKVKGVQKRKNQPDFVETIYCC
jgi:hypothetical protein